MISISPFKFSFGRKVEESSQVENGMAGNVVLILLERSTSEYMENILTSSSKQSCGLVSTCAAIVSLSK